MSSARRRIRRVKERPAPGALGPALQVTVALLILLCTSPPPLLLPPSSASRQYGGRDGGGGGGGGSENKRKRLAPGNHTRNAAVLVSSSRFWHNYRHVSNVLSMYRVLRDRGGLADEDIILMIADDAPCDARNPHRGKVFPESAAGGGGYSLYGPDVEIDYRSLDVTVDHFTRVLTGRHLPGEGPGRRLDLTPDTNLLVYLTGHGGDQFFKFQDGEEITAQDLRSTFVEMKATGRYNELLFIADTCQAFTMDPAADFGMMVEMMSGEVPKDVMTIGSSLKDQNSYGLRSDWEVGLSVIDRYTSFVTDFLKETDRGTDTWERLSLKEALVDSVDNKPLGANVGLNDETLRRKAHEIPVCDFFCAREGKEVQVIREGCTFGPSLVGMVGKGNSEDLVIKKDDTVQSSILSDNYHPISEEVEEHEGMRPSDPRFLFSIGLILITVKLSSGRW